VAQTWAISGVDLHVELTGRRVRAALETALREAVRTGRLGPGLRLPSSRTLAGDLGISRNTVAAAYGQLVAEGWLDAVQGSGTRVAARVVAAEDAAATAVASPPRLPFDLRAGSPDLAAFPRTAWLAAGRRALNAAPAEAFGYDESRGRPELREALAGYLARSRGVHAAADRIVICSGFAQGLELTCRALRASGATSLATESYGLPRYRDAVVASGLHAPSLRLDGGGAVIEELGTEDAVLLTAAHQFPLGVALATERRTQAVEWARTTGGVIVEDDYDGEFRYDRRPVGSMQALAPEHVVYAGTASKSLAPGLRLGWLVLPEHLDARVTEARTITGGPGAGDQLTLAELIASGAYDRHVRRARIAYRRRRDVLVGALAEHVPEARVEGIVAGLHAVVGLPPWLDEDGAVARARTNGLHVEALGTYRMGEQRHDPALVVGYGTPPEHAFDATVAALVRTLRRESSSSS
jgi:GntR family transcriptional regulator / MocR family aminotransferase